MDQILSIFYACFFLNLVFLIAVKGIIRNTKFNKVWVKKTLFIPPLGIVFFLTYCIVKVGGKFGQLYKDYLNP